MIDPVTVAGGAPSASRRWLLKLGGGLVGLLLAPELAWAAKKASGKSKPTASSAKAGASKRAASAKSAGAKGKGKSGTSSKLAGRKSSKKGGSRLASKAGKGSKGSKKGTALAERSVAADERLAQAEIDLESPPAIISPSGFSPGARTLSLHNIHTDESVLDLDYYIDGKYEAGALLEIDRVLRDYHTDEICPIDPALIDTLYAVRAALGSVGTFKVYSGYRSPETNAAFRRSSGRVAEHSYHIRGRAIDVALPGRELRQLRAVALQARAGGVGYYPWDGFVHIDSGPIRWWIG